MIYFQDISLLLFLVMAIYFKYSFFTPQTTVKALLAANVIVACLGALHWGFCILLRRFFDLQKSSQIKLLDQDYENSHIAYYAITGIQQILISITVILVILKYLGENNRFIWTRFILILLCINFAFNFVIAVQSSGSVSIYRAAFKDYFDDIDRKLNGDLHDYVVCMRDFWNFCIAQAIITWTLTIPLIVFTVIGFLGQNLKIGDDKTEISNKDMTTITQMR